MKRVAFIINPASGVGSKSSLRRSIARSFHSDSGWEVELFHTKSAGDAFDAAWRYKEESFDLIVAVGGDGTVNRVAQALIYSSVPMGIIPTGSGNGLARHLKIPLPLSKAIDVLLRGRITIIDSGSVNGQPFFCTAGIGFDANLANRFNTAPVRGFSSYVALSALEYVHYHPEKYQIQIEGASLEREAFLITFANCAQWGNNVYIAPEASASDGLLDMVIWKKTPVITIPFIAIRLLSKKIEHSDYFETIRGATFRIKRLQEGWAHVDGEDVQMGRELVVEVHPASLKVICNFNEQMQL